MPNSPGPARQKLGQTTRGKQNQGNLRTFDPIGDHLLAVKLPPRTKEINLQTYLGMMEAKIAEYAARVREEGGDPEAMIEEISHVDVDRAESLVETWEFQEALMVRGLEMDQQTQPIDEAKLADYDPIEAEPNFRTFLETLNLV